MAQEQTQQEQAQSDVIEKLVSLCKQRGFVYPSSEIYGGLNAVYDFGPLGVRLRRNIRERWWASMVELRDDVEGIETAILMNPEVWVASGHVAGLHRSAGRLPGPVQEALARGPPCRRAARPRQTARRAGMPGVRRRAHRPPGSSTSCSRRSSVRSRRTPRRSGCVPRRRRACSSTSPTWSTRRGAACPSVSPSRARDFATRSPRGTSCFACASSS